MTRVGLTISFTNEDGKTRSETRHVETSRAVNIDGEHRLAHSLFAELQAAMNEPPSRKYNAIARAWTNFKIQKQSVCDYFDLYNLRSLWYELASLIMSVEEDLIRSQAFKSLEKIHKVPSEDNVALNNLHYLHSRKMTLLNQAVYELTKVQDLVNRLLHESLGRDLVNTKRPDWEKDQLKRGYVKTGLKKKHSSGFLSQADFEAINKALAIPENVPEVNTVTSYRNRLTHHVRPSVDHWMFFSDIDARKIDPRIGEEVKDLEGNTIRIIHTISAHPTVQYRYEDLYKAFSEYLDAIVTMLQKLSELDILHR